MLRGFLVVLICLLSGCVMYPSKSVAQRGLKIIVADGHAMETYASVGIKGKGVQCLNKTQAHRSVDHFILPSRYSNWKFRSFLPMDCIEDLEVCTVDANGFTRKWAAKIGVFCNSIEENIELRCKKDQFSLSCWRL